MLVTPNISESCCRKVAPSSDWASNINGTISFQKSRVNDSKSSYAKYQRSPQVSMPSAKAVSRGMVEFEYRENQLAVFPTEIHHQAARDLIECTGANAGRFANCRRHGQIVPKVGRGYFAIRHVLCRKANDYSLLELYAKWLNSERTWLSLENAIILIDRQGGQIRSSGTEADRRQ
jgi:hypothetical protein